MGIEQIQSAKTKALLPAFQFNWSQMESNPILLPQNAHNRLTEESDVTERRRATTVYRLPETLAYRKPWSAGQVGRVQLE
jgi:hypothetical protein